MLYIANNTTATCKRKPLFRIPPLLPVHRLAPVGTKLQLVFDGTENIGYSARVHRLNQS